jgi:hypothetical protein
VGPAAIAARSGKWGIYSGYLEKREECLQQPKPNYKRRPRPKIVGCPGRYRASKNARVTAAGRGKKLWCNAEPGTRHSVFFWSLCGLCVGVDGVVRAAAAAVLSATVAALAAPAPASGAAAGSHLVDWVGEV